MIIFSEINEYLIKNTFVKKIYFLDKVPSTNSFAKEIKEEDNSLIITNYQTEGRGRYDKVWISEPNKNLTFSIKKKFNLNSAYYFKLNFFFTFFLLDSIIKFADIIGLKIQTNEFELKWPNDILFKSMKLSGILIEINKNKDEFIIGIGLNVNQTDFPVNTENQFISLKKIFNTEINLNEILKFIIKNYSDNLNLYISSTTSSELFNLWKQKCKMIGKYINVRQIEGKNFSGQVVDINEDGSIKLSIDGKIKDYYSGEIQLSTN